MSGFEYKPALPAIARFHADNISFQRLLVGAIGQGKTLGALADMMLRIATAAPSPDRIRRSRWLITRASFSQLKTTVLQTYRSLVGGDAAGRIVAGESPITHRLRFGDVDAEVWMLPCADDSDIERMLSLELTGALISEWTTAPQEVVRMAAARVGRYPSKAQGGVTPSWSGLILEGHMPEPDTWQAEMLANASAGVPVKDGIAAYVLPPALHFDGGRWRGNAEGINPFLPEGYYSRLILDQDQDWIRRYCANEMVFHASGRAVFAGLYSDTLHTLPEVYEPDPRLPVVIGSDADLYGASVLLQFLPGGRIIAFDELYANEAGIAAVGQALAQLVARQYPGVTVARGWLDPAGGNRGADSKTALEVLRNNSPWPWQLAPLPDNNLATRLEAVRHVLRTLHDGKPLLQVSPRAKQLRAALGGRYRFREMRTGGSVILSPEPIKDEFATVVDALQYGLIGGGIGGIVRGRAVRGQRSSRPAGQVYIAAGTSSRDAGKWVDP